MFEMRLLVADFRNIGQWVSAGQEIHGEAPPRTATHLDTEFSTVEPW